MPPKSKISKEQIIEQAFIMLKKEGYSSITTRRLADSLQCSTQPIYHLFANMEDLKKELYKKACVYFTEQIKNSLKKDTQEFLGMGLAYVKKAKEENHIFRFLYMENNYSLTDIRQLVESADESVVTKGAVGMSGLEEMEENKWSELFMMVWIFTHGIASITSNNQVEMSEEQLRDILIKAYKAFALLEKEESDA